jgi:acyl-CoA thioesterase I
MWRKLATLALALLIPAVWACGPRVSDDSGSLRPADRPLPSAPKTAAAPAPAPAPQQAGLPLVVFLGDSLTAGLGLEESQAYPALIEKRLREEGTPIRVLNAGVSGDTTAGGLSRLGWLLNQHPDVVVVGLGGNDGLRALPVEDTEKNLREILRRARETGARVLLLGLQIPPNYGPDYTRSFAAIYPRIAKDLDVPLVPFMLEGVGGVRSLNLEDGVHPNVEGQKRVAENVLPYLTEVLAEGKAEEKVATDGVS